MDFRRAFGIIEKRKWIIIFSIVLTSALVFGVTRLIPSQWKGTVRLISPIGSPLTDAIHKFTEAAEPDALSAAKIYGALAHSKEVMEPAARSANISAPLQRLALNIEFEGNGSRMYELRYLGTDPAKTRIMANALADNLIAQNRSHNSAEALRTVHILDQQLRASESDLLNLQRQYDKYCLDKQIIPGDFLNQVKAVSSAIEVAQTSQAEGRARLAQNRARLSALKFAPPALPAYQEHPAPPTDRENRITKQIEDLDVEIRQLRRRYNDNYPDLQARIAESKQLVRALNDERSKRDRSAPVITGHGDAAQTIDAAISADEALVQSESATIAARQSELDRLKRTNSRLGNLPSLITEKSENRSNIAARLNTAKAALDVAERQNPLSVLEYVGETNPAVNTSSGHSVKLVALAAFCAFIVAAGLAIFMESIDRRIKTVQEADELLPARVLAVIPQSREEAPGIRWARVADLHPLSPQSEAYRFLGQHLLSAQNRPYRSIMALAARSGQGNTRMMANLAITLAQAGQRVILVDANLRHPMLHKVFDLRNDRGLTDVLKKPDSEEIESTLRSTAVENLRVITSGAASSNPWELFSSHRLEEFSAALRDHADYILFDTPSALAYTDTLSLSTIANAALLCVRAVDPLTGAENRLGEMFALSDVHLLGSVLMDAPPDLIGSYERDLRDTAHAPVVPIAALEAGHLDSDLVTEPLNPKAEASRGPAMEWLPAHADSTTADGSQIFGAAPMSQEDKMDPIFEVTEPRLPTPATARRKPEEQPEPFDTRHAAVSMSANESMTVEAAPPPITSVANEDVTVESATPPITSVANEEVSSESATPPVASVANEDVTAEAATPRISSSTIEGSTVEPTIPPVNPVVAGAGDAPRDTNREEVTMPSTNDTPPGGFSKSIHGYNVGAVDDYVRKINSRLESLLSRVEVESSRADQSKRLLEQMTSELETMRRVASDAELRETSALEAQKHAEDEVARLVHELREARERSSAGRPGHAATSTEDADAERAFARSQIELVVSEVRRDAEEAGERAAAMYRDHEERVRALGAECEALVLRIKEAVEAQLTQLPSLSVRSGSTAGVRPMGRSDEDDDKRVRDNREWRSGDWRNAS